MSKTPTKFIGLHAHSTFSLGDGIGLPQEHIDFTISNGSDALALTDHGTMSGISHQQIKVGQLKKSGQKFKAIPGIEAYFVDSLANWQTIHAERAAQSVLSKPAKKKKDALSLIGNELADTQEELARLKPVVDEVESGTVVEDEAETKSKYLDPVKQRNHLVLLPKSNLGLKSLFQIVSESYINGFYNYPRVDFDMLRQHTKGEIVGLSACIGGRLAKDVFDNVDDIHTVSDQNFELIQSKLAQTVARFQEVLGPENYYAEIQFNRLPAQALVNMHLIELAKRTGVKLVATADSHYSNPLHWKEREVYKAMAWASKNKKFIDPNTLPKLIEELKCELYPKNADQMWQAYKDNVGDHKFYDDEVVCAAIERTHDIAWQQIGDVGVDKSVKLPALSRIADKGHLDALWEKMGSSASEDDVAFNELVRLAKEGIVARGKSKDERYVDRLKEELEVIQHLKFSKYFLTYQKIMEEVSKEMIIGTARGSAAGSLLAYVLGITQVDPIRFGLLFERFLTKFKKGYPDIDSDFSDRDKAVGIIRRTFGEENVIPVSNFNQLQLRSLIKDVARLHSLPFDEINTATSKIESEVLAVKKQEPGFDRGVWVLTYDDAIEHSTTFSTLMDKYPEFQGTIKVLFKQMRNVSRHAGGVIITDNAREGMPLIKAGGELQTPWAEGVNYRHLEEFGLLKFDILGLGTLRMFENCVRKILVKQGNLAPTFKDINTWFYNNLHPDNNGLDDIKVFQNVFWNGRYAGIFQFVQANTQEFMAEMKPTSILDIAIATSIFRPGPLSLKVDRKFLENRTHPENVTFKHPLLKEVFANTSGLLVFQEQLQLIYHKLGGIPLNETDGIRKAFTKKEISNKAKAQQDRDDLRNKFTDLCQKANGISEKITGEVFDEMEQLVAYSFNLSHAVSYAITSFQCAWLLTYYPDEWITSYLDYCAFSKGKVSGKEDPKSVAMKEAQRLGYTVGKPDINYSDYEYTMHPTEPKRIMPGIGSLLYVGKTAVEEIVQNRPYSRLEDLLVLPNNTWKHSKFNKRTLSTLVKLETLDSLSLVGEGKLFDNYKQLNAVVGDNFDMLKRVASKKKNNDIRPVLSELVVKAKTENPTPWTTKEKIEFQKDLAGSVDFSLLMSQETEEKLEKLGFVSLDSWDEGETQGKHWAIVAGTDIKTTKTGKPYLKIRLYAESSKEYVCFVWNYKAGTVNISENDVIVGDFKKTDFGLSSWPNKIFRVNT